jgi:hypothetical protein
MKKNASEVMQNRLKSLAQAVDPSLANSTGSFSNVSLLR